MRALPITPLLLGLLVLPGCGGSGGGETNPDKLWLVNDRIETEVKLTDVEPEPF
ncbi:MAG: hypothetical protein H7138_01640 [Myxococcales bacterium]|nr:hypothetical protein [Myxococcales bacterium]